MKRKLDRRDILTLNDFLIARPSMAEKIRSIKSQRRISLGLDITLYFENHTTIMWHIQEMLRIEKGGEAQIEDEMRAYGPLVPQELADGSKELVATLMIEIEDVERRRTMLRELCHIEKYIFLECHGSKIQAVSEDDVERTTEDGKTSAVHFLRFTLSPQEIELFKSYPIKLISTHPQYEHETTLASQQQIALILDLE